MVQLLGIPYDANSSFLKGPAYAPQRIRLMEKEGSANAFAEGGTEIIAGTNYNDCGDIYFADTHPERAFVTIHSKICELLAEGHKILSLGGDHSVSFPIISAYAEKYDNLHVLQLDAHGDLYERFDDNFYSHASPFARIMETGKVKSLTQVGIRTLSTHQREQAAKFSVNIIEMKDFSFSFIKKLEGPLYISLDIDVLDPAFAPGISHYEPGGMTTRELLKVLHDINVPVVGADIVEYNPMRDVHDMTAMVGYKLMKELIVKMMV